MADPVVHITNGIPDAGTGTITTLGQTLLDGANIAIGATSDLTTAAGAAGSVNSHLRTISRDIAGGIVLQAGGNTIGSVNQAGAPWSITGSVSVSGTATVSGTVTANQGGTWNINNIGGAISLPTGAATSAKQPNFSVAGTPSADVLTVQGATAMTALKVDGSAVTQPVSGSVGISGNVNCVQVTSPWVTSVSGNVSIVQGGNLTTRAVGNAGGIFDFASTQNVTAPAQTILVGAEYNTVPTTITSGNASPLQLDSAANLLVNVKTGTVVEGGSATSSQTSFAASTTSATILASNTSRRMAQIFNNSASANLFVLLGAGTANTTTAFSVKLVPGAYYELPIRYTGAIVGVWDGSSGNALVTELT